MVIVEVEKAAAVWSGGDGDDGVVPFACWPHSGNGESEPCTAKAVEQRERGCLRE